MIAKDLNDLNDAYCMNIDRNKIERFTFDSEEDKKYYTTLLNENRGVIDESKFQWKYIKEHKDQRDDLIECTARGFCIGGGVTPAIYLAFALPVFSWISFFLAMVTGGLLGATGGVTYKFIQVKKSTAYTDWKAQTIKNDIFKKFSKFIEDDEYLKDKLCRITHELIADPVQTTCKHVFEKNGLHKWLNQGSRKGIGPCPLCNREIKIMDLKEDDMYILGIAQRIMKLINIIDDKLIIDGMKAFMKAQIEDQVKIIQVKMNINFNKYTLGQITVSEFKSDKELLSQRQNTWVSWKESVE